MYLNILKKDLKRKKTMNVILLVFIILASMFVSSSVNNIVSVTTALDGYFDMAGVPDISVATMNKSAEYDPIEAIKALSDVESVGAEEIMYLSECGKLNGDKAEFSTNTQLLHPLSPDCGIKYFLDDGSVLNKVNDGEIYITQASCENVNAKPGDKVTVKLGDTERTFTLKGAVKDAAFGSNFMGMTRYIISDNDYKEMTDNDLYKVAYGGAMCYIRTADTAKTVSEMYDKVEGIIFVGDRALLKFSYVMDMIVAGLLLVVSVVLIIISFIVLRFTISFTLAEEFREIGVMKAIGIKNFKIRGLYMVKYAVLSVAGSAIGLVVSYPFQDLLLSLVSKSVIIGSDSLGYINVICSLAVILIIMFFCYTCTGKVKKLSPLDAVRNGQTGERFRKKSLMHLSRTKLAPTPFMAINDMMSSPKRYTIVTVVFTLCLLLIMIVSNTANTLMSENLVPAFGMADGWAVAINDKDNANSSFFLEGGDELAEEYVKNIEKKLNDAGIPCKIIMERIYSCKVQNGEYSESPNIYRALGTTMDMYTYTAGTAPQNADEIAITKMTADQLKVGLGDEVTIKRPNGDKKYRITAYFESMNGLGKGLRLHEDDDISVYAMSGWLHPQVIYTDEPSSKEKEERVAKIKELYPECEVITAGEWVKDCVGVADMMAMIKDMLIVLTVILAALITVLMERSFIASEKSEIALLKAIGFRNKKIYSWHMLRFAIVGAISIVIAMALAIPLTHLCIDPVFKMMGMELSPNYDLNAVDLFVICPLAILLTTVISALLTSLYTRTIKSSDTANIE